MTYKALEHQQGTALANEGGQWSSLQWFRIHCTIAEVFVPVSTVVAIVRHSHAGLWSGGGDDQGRR